MLNENLAKVRREHGLTQEALAVKLNVVRQTISKWENGTAVPDADMLCRIAEALEVPVSELLGNLEQKSEMDTVLIAQSLAEINEQLAIRNRQTAKLWKIAGGVVAGLAIFTILVLVWNLAGRQKNMQSPVIVQHADSIEHAPLSAIIELDENGVPLFSQLVPANESDLCEFFGSRNITEAQLTGSWGAPVRHDDLSASWPVSKEKVFTVFFTDSGFAYRCGIESR